MSSLRILIPALSLSIGPLAACSSADPVMPPRPAASAQATGASSASEALSAFQRCGERVAASGYRLGAGDQITIDVWGRADLSSSQTIGPDGAITLPVVGDLKIGGLDRAGALAAVRERLAQAYSDLVVTLRVDRYDSLRVLVLGEVAVPGEHRFAAPPDLLRAIGAAGGLSEASDALSVASPQNASAHAARAWKAAILRGHEAVLWVDLQALLRGGDMSLNVALVAGDVVHVSAEALPMIYVLGQVGSPGIFPLRPGATLIDALAMAGGTTADADDDEVRLLRPSRGERSDFDYDSYAVGNLEFDQPLMAGDVVYVPTSMVGEIGYFLRQFSPLAQILLFTEALND